MSRGMPVDLNKILNGLGAQHGVDHHARPEGYTTIRPKTEEEELWYWLGKCSSDNQGDMDSALFFQAVVNAVLIKQGRGRQTYSYSAGVACPPVFKAYDRIVEEYVKLAQEMMEDRNRQIHNQAKDLED